MPKVAISTILLICCMTAKFLHAGQGVITGREVTWWTEGRLSVVVGTMLNVRKAREPNAYLATIIPLATLAGTFDPSLHPEVPAGFSVGASGTSIKRPPPERALVAAVVQEDTRDDGLPVLFIVADWCTFMPDNAALVVLKDFNDPRIPEVLKKIQAARAEGAPPTTQSTTMPKD